MPGRVYPLDDIEKGLMAYLFHQDRSYPSPYALTLVEVSYIDNDTVILNKKGHGYFYYEDKRSVSHLSFSTYFYGKGSPHGWYLTR